MRKLIAIDSGLVDIEQLELKGFASSIAEIEWLLLVLVILYFVAPDAHIAHPEALVAAMVAFAAFVLGFHYINANAEQKRWKLALETWVMIMFITWVIWNTGGVSSPLINLYLLVIIISAITLGKMITLLEILLIGATYFYIASFDGSAYTYNEFSRLMIYFSPFVLVAYVTTLLVADLYKGRRLFKALAETDELTGLLNQRSFLALYDKETAIALENHGNLSLMMIDVDNLKDVNDQYGHQSGDKLIATVARTLVENTRSNDFVCRYGGDEFAIILPQMPAGRAIELGERVRNAVANTSFDVAGSKVTTSVSIGVATYPANVNDALQLLEKADECLYLSKRSGRNKVMHFEAEISPT